MPFAEPKRWLQSEQWRTRMREKFENMCPSPGRCAQWGMYPSRCDRCGWDSTRAWSELLDEDQNSPLNPPRSPRP